MKFLRGFVIFRPSSSGQPQGGGRWHRLNLSEAIRTMRPPGARPVRVPRVVRTGTGSHESNVSVTRQHDTSIGMYIAQV